MKVRFCAVIVLAVVLNSRSFGSIIVVSSPQTVRFTGAQPGMHDSAEPFFASATRGTETALLHLGDYSAAEVGTTRTFTRANTSPGEWDAYVSFRKNFTSGVVRSDYLWLGLGNAQLTANAVIPALFAVSPTFNLQQVDVKLNAFNRWSLGGNTYRFAEFSIVTYTLIPEPDTVGLALLVSAIRLGRGGRYRQQPKSQQGGWGIQAGQN